MTFNIMDLFGPSAMNRLLQPQQNEQGVQNFLAKPSLAQQQPALDQSRFGGGQGQVERVPAVGLSALLERLSPQVQANGTAQASVDAGKAAQGNAAFDPWQGMREGDVVPQDSMTTGAMQGEPARVQPEPHLTMKDRYQNFVNSERGAYLNDMFTGWAMGSTPSESLANGAKLAGANRGTRKNVNQTVEWLKGKGMSEDQAKMLAGSPPALNEYLKTLASGNDPMKALDLEKRQLEIENLRNPQGKLTSDQQEYQYAVQQGFKGNFVDYQRQMKEAGRSQVNVDTGVKLPSGYRWTDPNNQAGGVEPIPGGPAEQLPGELAARVGMTDNFLNNDMPAIRKAVADGMVTGPIDRMAVNNSSSKSAEVYRKMQSGVEVLSRLLSGAGMTQVEIDEKAARYMPSYTDTPESLASKMDQLEAELNATKNAALRGRGAPQNAQPQGVTDYSDYFKQ